MKVALIGNMNNNYFSLMRYMRDNGVDAELLMFADEIAHFKPEHDTWDMEKWAPYIKQTKIVGGALGQYFRLSADEIRQEFQGYDYYIGCGFTPAYFHKAGMQLDLFTPYCVGIEYTYRITKNGWIEALKEKIETYYQVKGLKHNTRLLGTIDEESRVKAKEIGTPTIPLPLLMIYNKEKAPTNDAEVTPLIKKFNQHYPVVFSHVSHFPKGSRTQEIKRNDILIKGFAAYTKSSSGDPLLVLFDYGPAGDESKRLIKELGIVDSVIWMPLMSRKKIMCLLEYVHFGGGEFGGEVWGGTGWEFMAKGVPFFQFVNMSAAEFERKTRLKMPPFFNVSTPEEITTTLNHYAVDENARRANGTLLQDWFNETGGIQLADKYIRLAMPQQKDPIINMAL